jgi:hypothetical protein
VLSALLIANAATSMNSLRHNEAVSTLNCQLLCRCSGTNVAAPLSVCTKELQRTVILSVWAEGAPESKIDRRLQRRKANVRFWNGNIRHRQPKRKKYKTQSAAGKVMSVFGIHKGQYLNTLKRGAHQQTVTVIDKQVVHASLSLNQKHFF